jgi:hypothetical protein
LTRADGDFAGYARAIIAIIFGLEAFAFSSLTLARRAFTRARAHGFFAAPPPSLRGR